MERYPNVSINDIFKTYEVHYMHFDIMLFQYVFPGKKVEKKGQHHSAQESNNSTPPMFCDEY